MVTDKMSKKSGTLSIISVFLRDGKTGDIKMTVSQNLRSENTAETLATSISQKIKERVEEIE